MFVMCLNCGSLNKFKKKVDSSTGCYMYGCCIKGFTEWWINDDEDLLKLSCANASKETIDKKTKIKDDKAAYSENFSDGAKQLSLFHRDI